MAAEIVRKTISLDSDVYDAAREHAKARGFKNSFSAYIAWLIDRDTARDVTPPLPRSGKVTYLHAAEDPPAS